MSTSSSSITLREFYADVTRINYADDRRYASFVFCLSVIRSFLSAGEAAQSWVREEDPVVTSSSIGYDATVPVTIQGLTVSLTVRTFAGYEENDATDAPSYILCQVELYHPSYPSHRIACFHVEREWSDSLIKEGCDTLIREIAIQFTR